MTESDLLAALREHRAVAIVRGRDAAAALDSVLTLAGEGVGLIEVSLSSTGAWDVIASARPRLGDGVRLGVGTVLTEADARRAAGEGAAFVVTPAATAGAAAARQLGLAVLEGAHSPSEVLAAHLAGSAAVKLFPASLGGPGYVSALRDPFPEIPLVPVGGVALELVGEYLAAGAVAVGIGSPLLGDAAHGGDRAALAARARRLLAALHELGPA
ncbi:MAG TPA: bifunctional 4-hydroxy-2-oxoglutarate aldolase/2-dehydro-3-deoxy-phosphogluconate aldolase [Acidimicrobiales bacterium]|nr:bifunctional 4-hydroxy-2-oxoglutarate aldolase/2-dehydro-3-deoxy-phosphogluconate aldolase [Acidimicrobiales bacterium]